MTIMNIENQTITIEFTKEEFESFQTFFKNYLMNNTPMLPKSEAPVTLMKYIIEHK